MTGKVEQDEGAGELRFEQALEELETIVEELEGGTLDLDDAMQRFERGLELVKVCRSRLEQAELRVRELLDDGTLAELDEED